jgi:4-hydroxy-tetrahydrodipicolinate synthase
MRLGGVLTAMVTPFDEHGRLAEGEAARLMHHLVEHGSDGLVLAGTTGEAPTLGDEEKLRLWRIGASELGGRATIVAGSGSNDTAHSVRLTEQATEAGVDAVLVVTPYYNKPNRRGLLAHFRAVAGATDLPVIVYNIPSRSVVDLPNDLLAELAELPNVRAVKQARSEGVEPIDGMALLAGNDEMLADVLEMGGAGGILVASHLVGPEMQRMIDEPDRRHEIAREIDEVVRALNTVAPAPATVKAAFNLLGHRLGSPRLPLVPASDDEVDAIRTALERHGLLSAV